MKSLRTRFSRPPVGAIWGWAQTAAGRTATDSLLPGAALVLSPHQDDETIGCGLLMAEKAKRGIPVAVAVATDGHAGWYTSSPRPAAPGIATVRHGEWHAALDALGVPARHRFELGFPDGELRDHEVELTDRIRGLLQTVRPDQVFVTRSGDPHPDHQTLSRALARAMVPVDRVAAAVPRVDAPGMDAPASTPHAFTYRVYPGEGLWPDDRPPTVRAGVVCRAFVRATAGLARRRPLVLRSRDGMAQKAAAIAAYASQARLLSGELHYVWGTNVELYWPFDGNGTE